MLRESTRLPRFIPTTDQLFENSRRSLRAPRRLARTPKIATHFPVATRRRNAEFFFPSKNGVKESNAPQAFQSSFVYTLIVPNVSLLLLLSVILKTLRQTANSNATCSKAIELTYFNPHPNHAPSDRFNNTTTTSLHHTLWALTKKTLLNWLVGVFGGCVCCYWFDHGQ